MLMPPWVKIVAPLLIAAMIFGMGFKVATWRSSGKVIDAEARATAAEKEAREATTFRDACIEDIEVVRAELVAMTEFRNAADAAYAEAVAQPPAVVTEYRDRWHTITEHVTSEDCTAALGELMDWIAELPAYSEEGHYE